MTMLQIQLLSYTQMLRLKTNELGYKSIMMVYSLFIGEEISKEGVVKS
jgi:hypothetical protein